MVKNKGGDKERFIQCGTLGRETKRVNDAPLPRSVFRFLARDAGSYERQECAQLSIPGPGAVLSITDSLESQLYLPARWTGSCESLS